jgi:M6 family metalloprotease-like protein
MRQSPGRHALLALVITLAGATAPAGTQPAGAPLLRDAVFLGLTRIQVTTTGPTTGLDAAHVAITRPDGSLVPEAAITGVSVSGSTVTVTILADQFGRITSTGTTIATRTFGKVPASRPIKVLKPGEPPERGHIVGSSAWTDEGWSTSRTDVRSGLYRFSDLTPNVSAAGTPVDWNGGRVTVPAVRNKRMLVLFLEFPDRRAADAGSPYDTVRPYLDFLQGAADWFRASSFGQMNLTFAAPQDEQHLGWMLMGRNAADYTWDGQTHNMFAYVREACQLAYDKWQIKADDYDMVLVMPARGRAGLFNGPGNINRDPTDGEQPNTNLVAYVDRGGTPHYIDTALTAGNDMFRWGYRWLVHESGHAFGFPDLYMYAPTVKGVRAGAFFYCGGWDMMGNIAGHSTEFLAWHKWKLRWVRDDQVDVVTRARPEPTLHYLSPVETPGGAKMVVVRTGLSTAYVAELRTRLGVNALDGRGKYAGVLIYRIDASRWEARDVSPTAQVISRKYYGSGAVGGSRNLTGVWRPIDNDLSGYDSAECCWQPGDVFEDPATGVRIEVKEIGNPDSGRPADGAYTPETVAVVSVTKTADAETFRKVELSRARFENPTTLTFNASVELQCRIANANAGNTGTYSYVREESVLAPAHIVITRSNGSVIPATKIEKVEVSPGSVRVTLARGAFASPADAAAATVATRAFFYFGPGAPIKIGR